MEKGILTIVPTPIGNLKDMTFSAIEALKEAELILCEDTRVSRHLLEHYEIKNTLLAYHKDNEHGMTSKLIEQLSGGKKIALISDAGTPGISDPGFYIVRACIQANISVRCLPGATAFVPALVMSGFPTDRFIFEGFLPHKKGRQTRLKQIAKHNFTTILYESPYRIIRLLEELQEFVGADRQVSVSREISKMFEETTRGSVSEVLEIYKNKTIKGEFVVVLEGAE